MLLSVFVTRISLAFLLFLHVRTFGDRTPSISYQNEKDYLALTDMKSKIIDDPFGVMKSWNSSIPICKWPGVTCGSRHKRVTRIKLDSHMLVGSLPPSLGNLSFLHELNLKNNTFQGKIPHEFGHLFRLQMLDLSGNSLEGEIPANLSRCSQLVYLHISHNNLTGNILEEFGLLSKLKRLIVSSNSLTGRIPPPLGNLTSLLYIIAEGNFLAGDIPETLGQLKDLTVLAFGGNQLSGTIPPSIYNISSLYALALAENQLHGSLPASLGLKLPYLQNLELSQNFFTGPLPISLSNASKLEEAEFPFNRFSGKITIDFGGLQNLHSFIVFGNNLGSGEPDELNFLSSMKNCTHLEMLHLGLNQLAARLPENLGNLSSQLSFISLAGNYIYGAIPSTIGNLIGLVTLALNNNQLSGTIPSSLGILQNLQRLALGSNKLSGEIPGSLGNLTLLIELYFEQNQLEGAIPPSLGNCRNLLLLNLPLNKLNSTIPKEIFGISTLSVFLDLSQNHLVGSLPVEIGELENLSEFDVSENHLSGEIPKSIDKCTSLVNLSLGGNSFSGNIPSSFSSLRGLERINISHNNFSGSIPLFLQNVSLVTLDMPFNDLGGEVPTRGIFSNASVLSVVGNRRLCGGIADLQLPNCPSSESNKHKISLAIILSVVASACLIIVAIGISYFLFCLSKRNGALVPASLSMRSRLQVTYGELFKATNGFSLENLIGMGSFGSVYRGIIGGDDGSIVAVKVFNLLRRGASKSFMYECEALREIRHRNLVKIISCCSSIDFQGNDFKALVYDFMPNGSLENWLHTSLAVQGSDAHHKLGLLGRVNIAFDVACALDYLHHHCQTKIVHCDIKPSNILLDSELVAHVGDFGLAKFLPLPTSVNDSNSIGMRGSIGYVAPEYGLGSKVSPHGDVYSYGILLLEMMTGKHPTDPMFVEGHNIHKFVNMAMPDHVVDILDPTLLEVIKGSRTEECLISIFQVALACSMDLPQDRMNMKDVVLKLQSIRNIIL